MASATKLCDMHCHLDFMDDMEKAAARAEALGVGCLSVTVTPQDYLRADRLVGSYENVQVGLGLHPWWIADGRCGDEDIALFERLAADAVYIGEVGLDFGKRHADTRDVQIAAFRRVVSACSAGGKVISIHAVGADDEVLDMLEESSCIQNSTCIFHWFSGSSDQLQRAIRAGCLFSVGPRMLNSKRGREYAKAIPEDRLLLETDAPSGPGSKLSYDEVAAMLHDALAALEQVRGGAIASAIAKTSASLLGGTV